MPTTTGWQLQTPIDAVIFDCDGTLSAIEGIDELAMQNHVGGAVAALTEQAMGKTGINPDIYRQRVELVKPSRQQVEMLGEQYYEEIVPDVEDVIHALQHLNKKIFIISAGLAPAVIAMGAKLNVPRENIFSVNFTFDDNGQYLEFDHTSPMTMHDGKRLVVKQIKDACGRAAHIGDGMNDFAAHDVSDRFIGFGGLVYRKNIAAGSEFYITSRSLASLLPLLLTKQEAARLSPQELECYNKGLTYIQNGLVEMNSTSRA
ncbi:MAG TPA: HAD-IB family phosphatase [Gammaproteobacteria bacterium]|jgi:phosphoserine phosphatase|nr:HAD-IB family phosphatase [Gammaproteobacteria bacterium]